MCKILKLILSLSFYLTTIFTNAQEKYAVLVAVDNYYEAPGVKHHASLSGCVNDAKAIRGLLENRFGFNPQHIYTLFDTKATKRNVINQLRVVFQKSKPGDAVVFFFSGHGVWMTNETLIDDPVKRGMSQAIVMNDLYSPGWDCLMRDETLKEIFNQFVDKKIIVTSILDCCYSANIMMQPGLSKYWDGWLPPKRMDKDIDISSIPFVPDIKDPTGCKYDSTGRLVDTTDSDGDNIPDCMDWEIHTPLNSAVNEKGVLTGEPYPDFFSLTPDNYFSAAWFVSDTTTKDDTSVTRSFNLKDALKVNNTSSIRPTDRKGSRFLSLAGAADNRKGLEISDISGIKHGAFTAALLMVYKTNPATITVRDLWQQIETQMAKQSYTQLPGMHADASRLNNNLVGIDTTAFMNKLRVKSISVKNKKITLDKGWQDGLANGNILSDLTLRGTVKIQVIKTYADSAIALDKSNGKILPGHTFEVSDPYTISNPYIKIHIPNTSITKAEFETFIKSKILPLANKNNYMDYNFEEFDESKEILYFRNTAKPEKLSNEIFGQGGRADMFTVLLPIPSYIGHPIAARIKKDQSFQLVSDPGQADLVLYFNYAKPRPGAEGGFILYWHPPIKAPRASRGFDIFSEKKFLFPTMNITAKQLQSATTTLYGQLGKMLRKKTNGWINFYERR